MESKIKIPLKVLMQLVNRVQVLNTAFLFLLFGAPPCVDVFGAVIVYLTCIYATL